MRVSYHIQFLALANLRQPLSNVGMNDIIFHYQVHYRLPIVLMVNNFFYITEHGNKIYNISGSYNLSANFSLTTVSNKQSGLQPFLREDLSYNAGHRELPPWLVSQHVERQKSRGTDGEPQPQYPCQDFTGEGETSAVSGCQMTGAVQCSVNRMLTTSLPCLVIITAIVRMSCLIVYVSQNQLDFQRIDLVHCEYCQDFEDFKITSDLTAVRDNCMELSENLHSQLDAVFDLYQDIEQTKKKLLEIQFNMTVASMIYDINY